MQESIEKYVNSCLKCQQNKVSRQRFRLPLFPMTAPSTCWRTMGVDLITDLPQTVEGYSAVCVFVDHLSRMVRLVPTIRELSTEGFAKLFMREVFPHYGLPSYIVSDRGGQWNSGFFRALCERAGITLALSSAHHPQTNGLVERMNEVISAALRHYVNSQAQDWDEWLPFVEFAMNNTYQKAIGATPFQMNRIALPNNPFEAIMQHKSGEKRLVSETTTWMGMSEESAGFRTWAQACAQYQWARRCLHLAKSRMKVLYDAQGVRQTQFAVGDWVWLNAKYISLRHPSRSHKLVPRYAGPIKIIELVGLNAARLDLPAYLQIHPVVSISLLKPYTGRVETIPPPVLIEDREEWELEAVIGHNLIPSKRQQQGLVEFQVKWKGGYVDSWHELSDFTNSLESVRKYLLTRCPLKTRKQIYRVLSPKDLEMLGEHFQREAKPR